MIYTGQGGQNGSNRQVTDQELTRGNLALVRSEERGLPVRVIRGAHRGSPHAPASGYRYDGLYTVIERWLEPSVDAPVVWRFVLEKADGGTAWRPEPPAPTPAAPTGERIPGRAQSVTQRVIRNSAVTQWVKNLHDHTCQVCGIRLEVDGGAYAEGAHIRALGRPHDGPDVTTNVLCLCPNDHMLFDKGAIYIDGGKVHRTADRTVLHELRVHREHPLDHDAIHYHRERFAGIREPE
jgi:putative restriction endonuclease